MLDEKLIVFEEKKSMEPKSQQANTGNFQAQSGGENSNNVRRINIGGLNPTTQSTATPGGFWIRFVALLIDGMILGVVQIPISLLIGVASVALTLKSQEGAPLASGGAMLGLYGLSYLVSVGSILLYFGWFYKNRGATPGKLLFNLRVVDQETGENLGYGKTFLREVIGKMLATITLGIGYLMAAFRMDKRGLHDLLAGTQVLKK